MPNDTISYFQQNINRKLALLLNNQHLSEDDRQLIDNIMDKDLPELVALAHKQREVNYNG